MDNRFVEELKQLVLDYFSGYEICIYFYGSRAKGTAHRISDIDIAIFSKAPLSDDVLPVLRDLIENSTIPYAVDVVDLNEADELFRNTVMKEGILWKSVCDKESK